MTGDAAPDAVVVLMTAPSLETARALAEDLVTANLAACVNLVGPVPADTAFLPERLQRCDAVVAMYHDQGLPVLKHASFGHAVNVTLGLPIVRTSVDHGTALDLAGTSKADAGSLQAALALALDLSCRGKKHGALGW